MLWEILLQVVTRQTPTVPTATWDNRALEAKTESVLFPGYLSILQTATLEIRWGKLSIGDELKLDRLLLTG